MITVNHSGLLVNVTDMSSETVKTNSYIDNQRFHAIILCRSGSGRFLFENGTESEVKASDAVFVPGGLRYSFKADKDELYLNKIFFEGRYLPLMINQYTNDFACVFTNTTRDMSDRFDTLFKLYRERTPYKEYILSMELYTLFTELQKQLSSLHKHPESLEKHAVEPFVSQLKQFYYYPYFTMDAACKACGVYPEELDSLFQSAYGVDTAAFMLGYRIERAKGMLICCENVGEVASACGFKSRGEFETAFFNLTGMSPLDFRNSYI